jgi:hypothetical protein
MQTSSQLSHAQDHLAYILSKLDLEVIDQELKDLGVLLTGALKEPPLGSSDGSISPNTWKQLKALEFHGKAFLGHLTELTKVN